MRALLTESCIDKLIQLAVGVGVVGAVGATGGVAAAIGAGQLAVTGLAGLGAIAAGRAIQSRVKEDDTARAVFEAVTKACGQVWLATGSEDAGIAQDVVKALDEGLDRLDFPITSIPAIRAAAGQADGLYAALADAMLACLDDPFGLLKTPRHRELARDILSDAVRAGVLASETLRQENILAVADMAVKLGRDNLAATREEGAATRDAMAAMEARLLAALQQSGRADEAGDAHLTRAAIIQLARRIARDVADFDTALAELDRAVTIAIDVMQDPARFGNVGAVVQAVLGRMAGLSGEGRHDEAADLATLAFADWERAEQERQDAARQQGLALLEAGLKQDILRRDADAAAGRIVRMLDLNGTPEGRFAALLEAVRDWLDRGRDQGLSFDLTVAIALARRLKTLARGPDQSGAAMGWLGNALQALGERESGIKRLEEAVAAYRAALEELTCEQVPLDWAGTQSNLGNALLRLGEREGGTGRLDEAIAAYRSALKELTRERVPLYWAMTQNNLGGALLRLGQRESGTRRLEEAVVAFREALVERTRERVPVEWAGTQNNLGLALHALGERGRGTGRLEEAVAAYRAALEEYSRKRTPLDWAATQNNLGNALVVLSARGGETGRLEEAVAAYRAALEERTRERVPLSWAMTQNNLGNALKVLGERESETGRLEEAVAAYRAALEEWTRERVPLDWAMTTGNLAQTQALIGQRNRDCGLARAAVAALEEVVTVFEAAALEPNTAYYRWALDRARTVSAEVCGDGDAG